jgi:hypothetical protein
MNQPKYPSLYQVNTRVWLTELSGTLDRKATLDDIPDTALDAFARTGFDWIWFLSVWTTGEGGRAVSRTHPGWRQDFEQTLPGLQEADIGGSGFAIADYRVHPDLGGDAALHRLRERLHERGLKLMLDFVPNHMGPDHPWVETDPEYFVSGTEADLLQQPQNYRKVHAKQGDLVLAYGRDPYFDGWPDTVQLDYSNPATVEAMTGELLRISGQCDGVRCDMAMLVHPEVFEKTWGRKAETFWPIAIKAVRDRTPGFVFMAEVYWDMEWALQQQGFDYAYDKRLYDRLVEGHAKPVREHFYAGLDYQDKLARFLENHDEPRAAATFEPEKHQAAAIITFLSPGLRFFHQGEFEGRTKRISPHLVRAPRELPQAYLEKFYGRLLNLLKRPVFREGNWQLLEPIQAWEGNGSWESFILFAWNQGNDDRVLIAVNFAFYAGQCYVKLPFPELTSGHYRLTDMMSDIQYDRNGDDMYAKGLYLDMPAWGYHVFSLSPIPG